MADYGVGVYRIGLPLLQRAMLDGFQLGEGGELQAAEGGTHHLILPALNQGQADGQWGRLRLQCSQMPELLLTVTAVAGNEKTIFHQGESVDAMLLDDTIPYGEKRRRMVQMGGMVRTGCCDVLLDGQRGQFLWLWLEVSCPSACVLSDLRLYVPGEQFFHTLPQVYQVENDFLRRYLAIFSTVFQEFQEEIDRLPDLLDVERAPEFMLPMLAQWLGVELDPHLFSIQQRRTFLAMCPTLMAWKGTRFVVEQLVRALTPCPYYLVERNLLEETQSEVDTIYGDSPYDVTLILSCGRQEMLRRQLKALLGQFIPVRIRLRIVFLEEYHTTMDSYSYLDLNGTTGQAQAGTLDEGAVLTGEIVLEE